MRCQQVLEGYVVLLLTEFCIRSRIRNWIFGILSDQMKTKSQNQMLRTLSLQSSISRMAMAYNGVNTLIDFMMFKNKPRTPSAYAFAEEKNLRVVNHQ